ncbi:hypothetical protein AMTR_s00079p00189690 [Amborella trichopoda]|uniref:Uncharacterized protein n=1 Tax=Amborella trichopoda TaxID=13333 RepID=W1P2G7_AMBTC|nr:hypothetical protein AMTR_s00079p00189690 [Amborella trichopoda]
MLSALGPLRYQLRVAMETPPTSLDGCGLIQLPHTPRHVDISKSHAYNDQWVPCANMFWFKLVSFGLGRVGEGEWIWVSSATGYDR